MLEFHKALLWKPLMLTGSNLYNVSVMQTSLTSYPVEKEVFSSRFLINCTFFILKVSPSLS